jgi:hypothetical protein
LSISIPNSSFNDSLISLFVTDPIKCPFAPILCLIVSFVVFNFSASSLAAAISSASIFLSSACFASYSAITSSVACNAKPLPTKKFFPYPSFTSLISPALPKLLISPIQFYW